MADFVALDNIRVVLCSPSHPGNIGAAARALKTMGLSRLVLIRPKRFPDADADARATGALDVLRSAQCHERLDEGLAGTTFVAGLSARRRDLTPEPRDARTAARELVQCAQSEQVAVLFGAESVGLTTDELSRCHRLVRIPANPDYSSLNLAASVQVMAYELRCACALADPIRPQGDDVQPVQQEEVERMLAHLEQTMRSTGFLHPDRPGRLMQRMRRMFARARPEAQEVAILRGFLNSVMQRQEH